jgi:hypothetical protein
MKKIVVPGAKETPKPVTLLRVTPEQAKWVKESQSVTGDEDFIKIAIDALGTDSPELALTTIRQMINLQGGVQSHNCTAINASLALLSGFQCKDPLELMMAVQLIALHTRAISCAAQDATSRLSFQAGVDHLDEILKLTHAFQSVMETLNKHRSNQNLPMKALKQDAYGAATVAASADHDTSRFNND